MLNFVGKIDGGTVTGPAANYLLRIRDTKCVFGVEVRKHPAFIHQIIASLWHPALHQIPFRFVIRGQFHLTEIRPSVSVHVYQADFQSNRPFLFLRIFYGFLNFSVCPCYQKFRFTKLQKYAIMIKNKRFQPGFGKRPKA